MRTSGILMHISSLPSPYGIGTMGKQAYQFIDFLSKSGQKIWQILPVGPTSYGDSPYQSFSTFAGNPYFIDFDMLTAEGLLEKEDYANIDWGDNIESVDFKKIYNSRFKVLRLAFEQIHGLHKRDIEKFRKENSAWIEDYALYMAVKNTFDNRCWTEWDQDIKLRKKEAVKQYEQQLACDIDFWIFVQYMFFTQWYRLKSYANAKNVRIMGDMPIYVALDSADVWANPELFQLSKDLLPTAVAGCPPDAFSSTGQLWGNPLYDWKKHGEDRYGWWIKRVKNALTIYDVLRIDHFRGFDSYYAIPFGDLTAENGTWCIGPGMELFQILQEQVGNADIIAEDLGYLTPSVRKLLADSGYPGMKVLQFAFDSREQSDYLPHNYEKHSVVYTGTHDNTTICDWFVSAPKEDIAFCKRYLRLRHREGYNWGFIKAAWASVSNTAIAPMQDFLNLDLSARMNTPSTLGGNWMWRARPDVFTKRLRRKIARMTKIYGR